MSELLPKPIEVYDGSTALCDAIRSHDCSGFSDRADGTVESSVGYFSQVSFDEDFKLSVPSEHATYPDLDIPADSHFIYTEDPQGFRAVFEYKTKAEADKVFEYLEAQYLEYCESQQDGE